MLAGVVSARNLGWVGSLRTADDLAAPLRGWCIAQTGYLADDPLNATAIEELNRRCAMREALR